MACINSIWITKGSAFVDADLQINVILGMRTSDNFTVSFNVVYIESPLDRKEIKPVHPKGNQSWIFTGRTDAEAVAPMLWPPDAKNWLIGKDPDAGEDWRREKRTTEDEMVGWHHQLDGYEFEQAPGVGDGQGSLVCCSPWGLQRVGHDWATELN